MHALLREEDQGGNWVYFDFDKGFSHSRRAKNVVEESSSVVREIVQILRRHKRISGIGSLGDKENYEPKRL